MFPRSICSMSLSSRDRKMAALKSRLSLAYRARNRSEITRLTRELHRLG